MGYICDWVLSKIVASKIVSFFEKSTPCFDEFDYRNGTVKGTVLVIFF